MIEDLDKTRSALEPPSK